MNSLISPVVFLGFVSAFLLPEHLPLGRSVESEAEIEVSVEEPSSPPQAIVLGDFNADGLKDIYAVNPYGEDRLLRNAGKGEFQDVTAEVGLGDLTNTRALLFEDYDADGLDDLVIINDRTTRLFRNIGGVFVDETRRAGLDLNEPVSGAHWEDFEQDGVLDLVLLSRSGVLLFRGLGDATFEQLTMSVPGAASPATGLGVDGVNAVPPAGPAAPGLPPIVGAPGVRPGLTGAPTTPGASAVSPPSAPTIGAGTWLGPQASVGPASLACAGSIEDQANPGTLSCIPASTTPTYGYLYPLGEDFFVASNGELGVGTLNPYGGLHIKDDFSTAHPVLSLEVTNPMTGNLDMIQLKMPSTSTAQFIECETELGVVMSVDRDGDLVTDGNVSAANVYAGTGAYNSHTVTVSPEDAVAPLRVLTNDGGVYTTRLKVETDGKVAIGSNNTPSGHLHVYGDNQGASVKISPVGSNLLSELWLAENTAADLGMGFIYDGITSNQLHVMGNDGVSVNGPWMSIQRDSGRVGIQTTNPQASLGVKVIAGSSSIIRGIDDTDTTVFRVTDTGRTVTTAVQITGGGDLVEGFESSEGTLEPGTVVIIDSENPGGMKKSSSPYDRKVAGVISGAGGVNHGIRMGQDGVLDGENLVAMTGRVYVKCSAENGSIQPGDLLTTAGVLGHAMLADDIERSFGAVIGKAMTPLEEGTGLVLVLVNLQ
jgi:hypothetical protein